MACGLYHLEYESHKDHKCVDCRRDDESLGFCEECHYAAWYDKLVVKCNFIRR